MSGLKYHDWLFGAPPVRPGAEFDDSKSPYQPVANFLRDPAPEAGAPGIAPLGAPAATEKPALGTSAHRHEAFEAMMAARSPASLHRDPDAIAPRRSAQTDVFQPFIPLPIALEPDMPSGALPTMEWQDPWPLRRQVQRRRGRRIATVLLNAVLFIALIVALVTIVVGWMLSRLVLA